MSSLALSNNDDYPAAAAKHLNDATALLQAGRLDGASYLSGYVVECSLRTVVMIGLLAQEAEITARERSPKSIDLKKELEPKSPNMRRFLVKAGKEARARGRDHDIDDLADATTGYKNVLTSYVAGYAPTIDKSRPPFGQKAKFVDIRYRAEGTVKDAKDWVQEAEKVYVSTIGLMIREGLLKP